MNRLLRLLFWILIGRPLVLVVLGLNVRNLKGLPRQGPAIVVANHNSHLDTFVLMSLFPLRLLHRLRPVAAADYFLRNRAIAWFTLNIVNMIPIERVRAGKRAADPLQDCAKALAAGEILLVYPEGTRGETEALAKFKGGVARLKEQYPDVPVVPVYMQGLSRALPKGEYTLVPVVVDVFVGEPVVWSGNRQAFTQALQDSVTTLAAAAPSRTWR
ncbi:lysophospholipid acyltransferase family protein [Dongia sedimenti]|uniref:Lysophospholipid acyltransferase family protein n=1 Tax=Dongia sedimenti TaxID=3064282 RepID=A0ABU0YFE4_9PROT|nr:lysophospholipid acyltransferase family protein [Rhodospirillaceae bacterium R-7]